ncbi:MAG: hypothetical protein KatS3mg091_256 [Patescibacteria group bacterium]|nr:MAG: hypothetical protein KatS3mg091_256 [Patescibacteria group bacterium]
MHDKFNTLGYKLHNKRLQISHRAIIRSIKYPITPYDNTNKDLTTISEKIINDDHKIRGCVNLNDYYDYYVNKKDFYTIINFWIDSLKAGVIWQSSLFNLIYFVQSKIKQEKSIIDKILENAKDELKIFEPKQIKNNLILTEEIRSKTTKASYKKKLEEMIQEQADKKLAENTINFILEAIFDEKGQLKLNQNQQINFWKEYFNLDKQKLYDYMPRKPLEKLTFVIVPDLIEDLNNDITVEELINKRKLWLQQKLKKTKIKEELNNILLTDKNFNGLSNYFGKILTFLQQNKLEDILKALDKIYNYSDQEKDKVKKALAYLAEKAKKLGKTSMPKIKNWSKYRMNFGKVQSWFSNMSERKGQIRNQIEIFKENLKSLIKELETNNDQEAKELIEKVQQIQNIINKNSDMFLEPENSQIINSLIGDFKKQINFYFQKNLKDNDKAKEKIENYFNRIYKPMTFYGQSIYKRNERIFKETIPILKQGIAYIQRQINFLKNHLDKNKLADEQELRNTLEFILNKIKTKSINSKEFNELYEEILKGINPEIIKIIKENKTEKYSFIQNPYKKGTQTVFSITKQNLENYSEILEKLINQLNTQEAQLLTNKNRLLDFIDLSRHIIAKLAKLTKLNSIPKDNIQIPKLFTDAKKYIELLNDNKIKMSDYNYTNQAFILSAIRGSATIYTQEKYLAKYTIQSIATDKDYPIYLTSNLIKEKLNKQLLPQIISNQHRYVISLDKNNSKSTKINVITLKKDSYQLKEIDLSELNNSFVINSSYYQTQFLDNFLYKSRKWKTSKIKLGEWSFILEKEYKINWDLHTGLPQFKETNSKKTKLYLNIPFNLESDKTTQSLKELQEDKNSLSRPIIGIDVGEYGLAYCIIKVEENTINILTSGFIHEPNIAKIKDQFSEIQKKARKGYFNVKTNTVAKVRETAIGSLRNKIHNLLIKYKPSYIIYEYSISNFETGSGRTTKIYATVKKSDVYDEKTKTNIYHDHIWGKRAPYPGRHLSSYASSYTCSYCNRSLYEISISDLKEVNITRHQTNKHILEIEFKSKNIKLYAYSKTVPKIKTSEDSLKEIQKIIKDFARPPISQNSAVLNLLREKGTDITKLEQIRKTRGNSAVFVCPNSKCNRISDADKQAAFIMALRGYINISKKEKNNSIKVKYFTETIEMLEKFQKKNLNMLEI